MYKLSTSEIFVTPYLKYKYYYITSRPSRITKVLKKTSIPSTWGNVENYYFRYSIDNILQ